MNPDTYSRPNIKFVDILRKTICAITTIACSVAAIYCLVSLDSPGGFFACVSIGAFATDPLKPVNGHCQS